MVNVSEAPVQVSEPNVYEGVTVIVATWGVLPPFTVVNVLMFPVPLRPRPMLALSLVHE